MTHTELQVSASKPKREENVQNLSSILDEVIDVAQTETLSLRDVVEPIGDASFAPLLLLPALAVATPLSGIPLFSTLMGVMICLVSAQMLLRGRHIWLPDWVLRKRVKGRVVRRAFQTMRPFANWVDRKTEKRLRIFVHRPLVFIPQLICVLSGMVMPLLEFVPFSSSIMGMGVALLALGMVTRDGLVIMLGLVPYAAVGWLVSAAIPA